MPRTPIDAVHIAMWTLVTMVLFLLKTYFLEITELGLSFLLRLGPLFLRAPGMLR